MSISLDGLVPTFKSQVDVLIAACAARGVEMRPYYGRRSPWEQARIWRSTRATGEITDRIERLKSNSAPFLGKVILEVGPQSAPPGARGHLTNAAPGNSWHQWGEAVDCFWCYNDVAQWSTVATQPLLGNAQGNGYLVYADEATKLGLLSGGAAWGWDYPHVQLRLENSPRSMHFTWSKIDTIMRQRFGETEVS